MNFLIRRRLLFHEQTLDGRPNGRPVAFANVVLIKSSYRLEAADWSKK